MVLDWTTAAVGFSGLGAEPRLRMLRVLVRAGPDGLSVGQLQASVDMPASTMSHHLKAMADADLITQLKRGRTIINIAHFEQLEKLAKFILLECCNDVEARRKES